MMRDDGLTPIRRFAFPSENRGAGSVNWGSLGLLIGLGGLGGMLLWHFLPGERPLIAFALYSIPSNVFILPLPHEPALFYCAKFYVPWVVTLVGALSNVIANYVDYQVLYPLLHLRSVRARYADKQIYQKLIGWFRRWPFWILVITSYTPIPFYPFKFLSIADGYPLWKYQAALLLGRMPRYYLLAMVGYAVQPPVWVLIVLGVLLLVLPFVRKGWQLIKEKLPHYLPEMPRLSRLPMQD
ncbi:MAG: hypothetical protein D6681_01430 [Calditrichaeota bacterium]|nr:MAG: hypothetical protein D6681_01430 [Calditrichota bacterium]